MHRFQVTTGQSAVSLLHQERINVKRIGNSEARALRASHERRARTAVALVVYRLACLCNSTYGLAQAVVARQRRRAAQYAEELQVYPAEMAELHVV